MQIKLAGQTLELWIYETIGLDPWTGEGVTAKAVSEALRQNRGATTIQLRINSMGGDAFDGVAIYNLLASHKARVEVDVDGIAASAASIIAMAGDEIRMAENAMMMIHEPWGLTIGDATEHRKMAESLEKNSDAIGRTYAARSGLSLPKVLAMMADETWFTAKEAKELGLADKVTPAKKQAASLDKRWLARFKNAPQNLLAPEPAAVMVVQLDASESVAELEAAAARLTEERPRQLTPSPIATLNNETRKDSWSEFSKRSA